MYTQGTPDSHGSYFACIVELEFVLDRLRLKKEKATAMPATLAAAEHITCRKFDKEEEEAKMLSGVQNSIDRGNLCRDHLQKRTCLSVFPLARRP